MRLQDAADWGGAVVTASVAIREGLDRDDVRDDDARAEALAAAGALLAEHGTPTLVALASKRDAALEAAAVARRAVETARHSAVTAEELDQRIETIEPLSRALDAFHSALSDAKFKNFVAKRKQENLLGVATTMLRRMTDDRYGFGTDFKIVDRSARQERSPQTLSGGEKFLASLALSLALVEIAARSGNRFGALFLDEGFGALDPHALDEALSELERQSTAGRLIGVITHVRAVTEYIDDVLRVTRTPMGSDVQRLRRADEGGLAS